MFELAGCSWSSVKPSRFRFPGLSQGQAFLNLGVLPFPCAAIVGCCFSVHRAAVGDVEGLGSRTSREPDGCSGTWQSRFYLIFFGESG